MKNKKEIILFSIYIIFLIYILFYNGREASHLPLNEYIKTNINLEPLKMITIYYNGLVTHKYYYITAFINLIANLLIFMPMGILIPKILKNTTIIQYIIIMLIIIIGVELLQLLLKVGIFDIDDIILNFTGSLIGYISYKIYKGVQRHG